MAKKTRRARTTKSSSGKSGVRAFKAELAGRLQEVAGKQTYREIGQATATHPENTRRYIQRGTASVFFLRSFCKAYKVNPSWLMDGTGQRSKR